MDFGWVPILYENPATVWAKNTLRPKVGEMKVRVEWLSNMGQLQVCSYPCKSFRRQAQKFPTAAAAAAAAAADADWQ